MISEKMGNYKVHPFLSVDDARDNVSLFLSDTQAGNALVVSNDNDVIVVFIGINERGRFCYLDKCGTFNTSEDIHTKELARC